MNALTGLARLLVCVTVISLVILLALWAAEIIP